MKIKCIALFDLMVITKGTAYLLAPIKRLSVLPMIQAHFLPALSMDQKTMSLIT